MGTSRPSVGDHDLTFYDIFKLVDNIFRKTFIQRVKNETAAKLLKMSLNISIKDAMFTQVAFGDLKVLICEDYLGHDNIDRVFDVAMVDNQATIFIFSDSLTNEKVRRDVRASRLFDLFSILVEIYSVQEYMNIIGSIYSTIVEYAPLVLTVRLIETFYGRNFIIDKDWNPEYYPETYGWFDEEALDVIHKVTDRGLLEFGALVPIVDKYKSNWE